MKRLRQPVPAEPQQPQRYADPEYLTLEEAATLCRFDVTSPSNPANGFRKWAKRQNVPMLRRGRVLLVERRILVGYLTMQDWRKRRTA